MTNLKNKLEIRRTLDGSDTLFVPELNEHYHSVFGALQESTHVFIKNGFLDVDTGNDPVSVLEVGFGTGLNALLTNLTAKTQGREVHYAAIEKYPLEKEAWSLLNYPLLLQEQDAAEEFRKIHEVAWEEPQKIHKRFTLTKIQQDIRSFSPPKKKFHIVYFDAFGPDVQPDLWSEEVFQHMYHLLMPGGILITYSCKGKVKRNLKIAGFTIEKLPAPPGKREILRARKS